MAPGRSEKTARQRRDARKETQRERLIDAMIALAGQEGYGGLTIAQIIARAGVSRPTFYEYFPDTEACLSAAVGHVQQRLLIDIAAAVAAAPGNEALLAVSRTVSTLAVDEPAAARVLMSESLAGGSNVRDMRDAGLRAIDDAIEHAYATTHGEAAAPDISGWMVVGGLYRLIARRLRRGEPVGADTGARLEDWIKRYERPLATHRWRTLSPCPPAQLPPKTPILLRPIGQAERRARQPPSDASIQREQILFAAAEIAAEHGYGEATIAEITRRTNIDARAFHKIFSDQSEVTAALQELFYQHLMTVSAGAFFSEESWPERIWDAGLVFCQAAEQDPLLAYVSFVEGPAAHPAAVQRYDDLVSAFTIFLEQGYGQESRASGPSNVALEAVAWTTHEAAYARARSHGGQGAVELLPHISFVALAPFLGVEKADEFIDEKLASRR
jgi:AcrR family transcriptional regulator